MRKLLPAVAIVTCTFTGTAKAQSPTVPINSDYYRLIDRYEIKSGRWASGFHSSFKPYNRHQVIQLTDSLLEDPLQKLSMVDRFNIQYLRNDSWEWLPANTRDSSSAAFQELSRLQADFSPDGSSRRPFLKTLYRKKSDAYHYENADFDVHVSPVVQFAYGFERITSRSEFEQPESKRNPFINTRGVELRGSIRKRLGFYTSFTENQIIYPVNLSEYRTTYGFNLGQVLAPGEALAKLYGKNDAGVDFTSARGYITFNALKVINIQFGHDKNFIGNGIRSLFLSDNSAPYPFLKITTRLGRFQYTNLFAELQNTQQRVSVTEPYKKKYAAIHHLSVNISDHVNMGLFEGVILSRDRPELNYLNPIILYRFLETYQNSADNALMGIDFKANFARKFLVYSQFMLDEFRLRDITARQGAWTNKFAFQTGVKYLDVLGVPNLDLTMEMNLARPFTYSHRSGQTNYVGYSQPLAHPLGGNFIEGLGIINYQPHNRLAVTGTFAVMRYGADPPDRNYGSNLLLDYNTRFQDNGNTIGQGRNTVISYGDLRVSYMLKHNFFIDFRQLLRMSDSQLSRLQYNSSLTSLSIRWNMPYHNMIL